LGRRVNRLHVHPLPKKFKKKFKKIRNYRYKCRAWGDVVVKPLVGRSRDRSSVVSLGIFSMTSDNSMYPGSTQPLKMITRILLGVKTAGAYG
jgi:hypothetical protein